MSKVSKYVYHMLISQNITVAQTPGQGVELTTKEQSKQMRHTNYLTLSTYTKH